MEEKKEDNSVMDHLIQHLTEKEEHIYGKSELTDGDVKDMHTVESELDRYWDLLRFP